MSDFGSSHVLASFFKHCPQPALSWKLAWSGYPAGAQIGLWSEQVRVCGVERPHICSSSSLDLLPSFLRFVRFLQLGFRFFLRLWRGLLTRGLFFIYYQVIYMRTYMCELWTGQSHFFCQIDDIRVCNLQRRGRLLRETTRRSWCPSSTD